MSLRGPEAKLDFTLCGVADFEPPEIAEQRVGVLDQFSWIKASKTLRPSEIKTL